MITGAELADVLYFRRNVIQNEIVKLTTRLLVADKRLNVLRIDEAFAWRAYASRPNEGPREEGINIVKKIVAARHNKAENAVRTLKRVEIETADLHKPYSKASQAFAKNRSDFDSLQVELTNAVSDNPEIKAIRAEILGLSDHVKQLASWLAKAKIEKTALLDTYDTDPVFRYLREKRFGTSSYNRSKPLRSFDSWLASAAKFEQAAQQYDAIVSYEEKSAAWTEECAARFRFLKARIDALKTEIMAPLDSQREQLARAINLHHEFATKMAGLNEERAEAMGHIVHIAMGADIEHSAMVDAFVELLSNEQNQAMARIAASGEEVVDPYVTSCIDEIVRERLEISSETYGIRHQIADAGARLHNVEELVANLVRSQWDKATVNFVVEEESPRFNSLVQGMVEAREAWLEIEESVDWLGTADRPIAA